MPDAAALTLIIGPQTDLALSLNAVVRTGRAALGRAGMTALPSRLASPLLRRTLDPSRPFAERASDFAEATRPRPAFLSAVNFLGPPQAGLHRGEIFPDAEGALAGLSELTGSARIVFLPDSLPAFLLASGSDVLEERVRRTSWETLYELSWADLAREVTAALPGCRLTILTPRGAAIHSAGALLHLFGAAAEALPDPQVLLRNAVDETGGAVLDRILAGGEPDEPTRAELYDSFARRPDPAVVAERLGIDRLTMTLLEQRFDEDLDAISALPGAEVI